MRVIRTEKDLDEAIAAIKDLAVDANNNHDLIEVIFLLIADYNKKTAYAGLDAVDAIKLKMRRSGLRQKDLIPLMGIKSRISEVLGRKKQLTLSQIRGLHSGLNIPLEVLIGETR